MLASGYPELIGFHTDITNNEYHAGPGVSKSTCDKVRKSYNHLKANFQTTRYMLIGTATHSGVLEPGDWPAKYMRGPRCDRRTKQWIAAEAEAVENDLTLMDTDDFDRVDRMIDAVWSHNTAAELLSAGGTAEGSIYWEDPITKLLLKARPDMWAPKINTIVDLKTAKDSSPDGFARSCGNFFYDVQDSFYTDGISLSFGLDNVRFLFIVVENSEPHNVAVYELTRSAKNGGRKQYREDLGKYLRCLTGKECHGYSDTIETIELPRYARRPR